jgi:retron-type reverse transcriptase
MLTRRSIIVNFGNLTLEGKPAKDCPQGGVLSPLLWSLVVNELLVEIQKTGLSTYGYANDVTIVAKGNFLSTLKELIEKALKIVQNWCQAKGNSKY